MTSAAFHPTSRHARSSPAAPLQALTRRALDGDRTLVAYAAVLLVLAAAFAVGWLVDERVLRGANVWIKPFKFAMAIALLAFTTALFASVVERSEQTRRPLRWIRRILIAAGSFELGYIALQASLGQASHFNVGDAFHGTMYTLMGIGAIALTATQPALAWQVHRHAASTTAPALRSAIVLGLVLTFMLGASAGIVLSALPAVSNAGGWPIVGWSLQGGDLRPAHFLGIHAAQLLPLVGFVAVARRFARPGWVVWAATLLYVGLFLALVAWALVGRS